VSVYNVSLLLSGKEESQKVMEKTHKNTWVIFLKLSCTNNPFVNKITHVTFMLKKLQRASSEAFFVSLTSSQRAKFSSFVHPDRRPIWIAESLFSGNPKVRLKLADNLHPTVTNWILSIIQGKATSWESAQLLQM